MATQKESDIAMLVAGQCHLGTKNCTAAMERYTFKRRSDGIYVFDLGRTYEKLCLAARVIVAIENPQDVVAISARPYGQRGVLKFANYLGARATVGRHTPGEKALARAGAWQGNARGGRGWAGHGGAAVTFLGRGGGVWEPQESSCPEAAAWARALAGAAGPWWKLHPDMHPGEEEAVAGRAVGCNMRLAGVVGRDRRRSGRAAAAPMAVEPWRRLSSCGPLGSPAHLSARPPSA